MAEEALIEMKTLILHILVKVKGFILKLTQKKKKINYLISDEQFLGYEAFSSVMKIKKHEPKNT